MSACQPFKTSTCICWSEIALGLPHSMCHNLAPKIVFPNKIATTLLETGTSNPADELMLMRLRAIFANDARHYFQVVHLQMTTGTAFDDRHVSSVPPINRICRRSNTMPSSCRMEVLSSPKLGHLCIVHWAKGQRSMKSVWCFGYPHSHAQAWWIGACSRP